MEHYFKIIKRISKNNILQYMFNSYAIYFIQFINSIFIAVYLGPYYFGIWGFITLIIQYINQFNFGIAYSVNAIISINKRKEWYVQKIINTSITMLIGLSLIVCLIFFINQAIDLNFGDKYTISNYYYLIVLIGILGYFNSLMSAVFRVYGKISEIILNQSTIPVLMLIVIFFFKGENLLWALLLANLIASLLSFCVYFIKSPVKIKPLFITRLVVKIQRNGWYLFVYNSSFYLIIISTKSFIAAHYSVKEFGYFTFSFTLANVVLLLLQSFSFLIFPKLLNRLALASNNRIIGLLKLVRESYVTGSHLLIHISILLFPLFIYFFPQYNQSNQLFKLIALTVVLYTNSYSYSDLLIAKGFEKKLAILSFLTLILNIILLFILVNLINIPIKFVFVATMSTYFIYIYYLGKLGRKILSLNLNFKAIMEDLFATKLLIPYVLSFILITFSAKNIYFTLPIILFILLNFKEIIKMKTITLNIIKNPNVINI